MHTQHVRQRSFATWHNGANECCECHLSGLVSALYVSLPKAAMTANLLACKAGQNYHVTLLNAMCVSCAWDSSKGPSDNV